ncbi:hypothetical protein EVAR_102113_1 [Eumeta japonica]|uniref:Uncharacterized protein n=1 Tax=Eumeta variegata TaxID=151549 RepID=A0A4C1TZR9_EUMVA|nr:hypothetical protein EVAR_102113_1 [Eumeta japonica]
MTATHYTRGPRGVASSSPASWKGIEHPMEENLADGERNEGSGLPTCNFSRVAIIKTKPNKLEGIARKPFTAQFCGVRLTWGNKSRPERPRTPDSGLSGSIDAGVIIGAYR